jgi:4-hydroxy-tetrahydrodipicolinate synthase
MLDITKQKLWTACVTPFDATGEAIDYRSLERLLKLQAAAGNGILLFGSTGEGLSLSTPEKQDILRFACGLKLDVPIIVGVPSYNLHAALEWLELCKDFPISGYLMTTPIYTKPGVVGQTRWFETLLNKSTLPAILYNIPGRSGVSLHPQAVKALQGHERFVAMKDSSGTIESVLEYKAGAPDIALLCGDDYLIHEFATAGCVGLVSVASNAWPVATRGYVDAFLQGRVINSELWIKACKSLFTASNPIPIKALLKDLAVIEHDTVRLPLSIDDLPSRQILLAYTEQILNHQHNRAAD